MNEQYHLVYFGIWSYSILESFEDRGEAERRLSAIQREAEEGVVPVAGYTRAANPYDFDVRTQKDLDDLTKAIHSV